MSIQFSKEIVDKDNKAFSTTTLYDMFEAIQPIYPDKIYLVPRTGFTGGFIPATTKVVVIPEGLTEIPNNALVALDAVSEQLYVIVPPSITTIREFGRSSDQLYTHLLFYGSLEEWEAIQKNLPNHDEISSDQGFPIKITFRGTEISD